MRATAWGALGHRVANAYGINAKVRISPTAQPSNNLRVRIGPQAQRGPLFAYLFIKIEGALNSESPVGKLKAETRL